MQHSLPGVACRSSAHPTTSRKCHSSSSGHRRARHRGALRAAEGDDAAAEPQLFGDWREFRAKLVLGGHTQGSSSWHLLTCAAAESAAVQCGNGPTKLLSAAGDKQQSQQQLSEENLKLLEIQNPKLASEGIWAHATAAVEKGGLLLATPDNPLLLGTETYCK